VVLCTLISAPIMFISSRMAQFSISKEGANHAINTTGQISYGVSAVAALFVAVLFVLLRRTLSRGYHQAVLAMAVSSMMCSIAAAVCPSRDLSPSATAVQTIAFFWGRGLVAVWLVVYALAVDGELFAPSRTFGCLLYSRKAVPLILVPLAVTLLIVVVPGSTSAHPHVNCFLSSGKTPGDVYQKIIVPLSCLIVLVWVLGRRLLRHQSSARYNTLPLTATLSAGLDERAPLLQEVDLPADNNTSTSDVEMPSNQHEGDINGSPVGRYCDSGSPTPSDASTFKHTVFLTLETIAQTLVLELCIRLDANIGKRVGPAARGALPRSHFRGLSWHLSLPLLWH